jgi:hypothetical protein
MNLNIKAAFDKKKISALFGNLWRKVRTSLFFGFFVALIVLGGYIWRQSLYKGDWSVQEKQEYLNAQNKGVVFQEDDFKNVVSDIQARQIENAKPYQPLKDIFQPYK